MTRFKQFLFRPATNEDIPSIKNVVYSALAEFGLEPSENGKDGDLSDIERSYFSGNGFFGVVVDVNTNEVVGTIGLFAEETVTGELRKMYIKKDCRHVGLGRFMLNTILDIAREKGFKKIYLETISPLKIAIALYKSVGFQAVQPREISNRVDQAFEVDL